jgi:hypothetical protein
VTDLFNENAKEIPSAYKAMPEMWTAIQLEKKMGKMLGRSKVLLRKM